MRIDCRETDCFSLYVRPFGSIAITLIWYSVGQFLINFGKLYFFSKYGVQENEVKENTEHKKTKVQQASSESEGFKFSSDI